jgi:predicted nucleic acid-binding protein
MNVVSNTGPLIALAKIDRLALLQQLFGEVFIPPVVHRELLGKAGAEANRLDQALATFVHVHAAPIAGREPEVAAAIQTLDAGERDAVVLSYQLGLSLIIDDRLGRQAARRLGLAVAGSAGVLIQAQRRGLIASVRQELEMMRSHGYWLSDDLIEAAAKFAGE